MQTLKDPNTTLKRNPEGYVNKSRFPTPQHQLIHRIYCGVDQECHIDRYDAAYLDAQRFLIKALDSTGLENYTIIQATGHWKGQEEECFIVEVLGGDIQGECIRDAARIYKMGWQQESVLYTCTPITSSLL